jgi:cellulose biosynthesis protein BcsQ
MTKESTAMVQANGKPSVAGRIYWVGGSKGGVGKSMMTAATVDYLFERGEKVLLVDCDTSNPDVWKAYKEQVETVLLDLDEADGWIHLVNTCDGHRDGIVVINTAARNNLAVRQYGATLDSSLEELGSRLVALWVINRQRDSLELLKEFMDAIPKAEVHVVRNGYFGAESKFELYEESKVREIVMSRGGKSLTLPDLADRVADDLYSKRLSLRTAAKTLPIGNRAELGRWRSEVRKVLDEVMA